MIINYTNYLVCSVVTVWLFFKVFAVRTASTVENASRKINVNAPKDTMDFDVNSVSFFLFKKLLAKSWNLTDSLNSVSAKCVIPCMNGGKCRGANKCRCPEGYRGNHCEIGHRVPQRSLCTRPCRHGTCQPNNTCLCDQGWVGRICQQSKKRNLLNHEPYNLLMAKNFQGFTPLKERNLRDRTAIILRHHIRQLAEDVTEKISNVHIDKCKFLEPLNTSKMSCFAETCLSSVSAA